MRCLKESCRELQNYISCIQQKLESKEVDKRCSLYNTANCNILQKEDMSILSKDHNYRVPQGGFTVFSKPFMNSSSKHIHRECMCGAMYLWTMYFK